MQQSDTIVDADLEDVRLARAGDRKAFERLYRRHVGRVYALCLRLVADPEQATELTQEAFIRAWEHLGTFRNECAFSSWLHRVTVNRVLGWLRSKRRRLRRVRTTDTLGLYDRGQPGSTAAAIDLEGAIAALPQKARTVFVLHDIEGYLHGEIAAMMEIAEGTSKAHLHRARRLLQKALRR